MSSFRSFKQNMTSHGLKLCHVFPMESMPASIKNFFHENQISTDNKSLLFIGNSGKEFWKYFHVEGLSEDGDPLDGKVVSWIQKQLQENGLSESRLLYPNRALHFPLNELFLSFGLATTSRLGMAIHPTHGLWWAARYCALVERLNEDEEPPFENKQDLCDLCQSQDCQKACPAMALENNRYDYDKCKNFRLQNDSPCKDTCLARRACPVNQADSYPKEQESFHMLRNLDVIKKL